MGGRSKKAQSDFSNTRNILKVPLMENGSKVNERSICFKEVWMHIILVILRYNRDYLIQNDKEIN